MRTTPLLAVLAVGAMLGGTPACAAEPDSPERAMYLRYCGACHGPKGEGDGVAATVLQPKPSNLTIIAKKNGGQFPAAKVTAFIDGTQPLPIHGSPDMPVWGELLRAEQPRGIGVDAAMRSKLMILTEYLRSIQTK